MVPGDPGTLCSGRARCNDGISPLHHHPTHHLAGISNVVLNPSKELGPCFLLTPREYKFSPEAGGGVLLV